MLTDENIAQIESNYDEVTDSFDNMSLKPELLRGLLLSPAEVRGKADHVKGFTHMGSSAHPLSSNAPLCQS